MDETMTEENLAASTGEPAQETGAGDEQNDIIEQTNNSESTPEPADEQPAQDVGAQAETETSDDQQSQPTDIPPGFEPKSCSVKPKHPIFSPLAIAGSHFIFCSSLPNVNIGYITNAD